MNIQRLIFANSCINKSLGRRYKSYSDTILLPKTSFPLRLENTKLTQRDKTINEAINSNNLYKWQKQNLSEPEFVLHDGPPYANGSPHMGHAINKILKDVVLRYKILEGKRVNYVPGWDCHGLPIELKAVKDNKLKDPLEIRKKAREFAKETIIEQKQTFQSWGIIGEWDNSYMTFNKDYIQNQYQQFYKLYSKNLIYRDFKPIHWSPSSQTALAESELEYKENHQSPSAYVRFKIESIPQVEFLDKKPIYALIWTTTPWTLPSNQAVCYNPKLTYCFCTKDSEKTIFIAAIELIDELKKVFNSEIEILATLPDGILSKTKYRHPIYKEQVLPFIVGDHVTASKGTGLVHTAPGHGNEDFLVALNNKISIVDFVNDEGCYNDETGHELKGKFVLDEGNDTVLKILNDDLVHLSKINHSYPYDWRTKKPVITKPSSQWFLDTNYVKKTAIESLKNVKFLPKSKEMVYKEEFLKQIEKRPFWCISRQRKWGVPIPVFYNTESNSILLNQEIINHQIKLIETFGSDYWWLYDEEKLLPEEIKKSVEIAKIKKGQDIFDIWFDSGISWSKLVGDKVADLYIEGGDQLNGWFYASLMTSLASREKVPYKSLYIHGFAVDNNGLKMSKSLGNVVDPKKIIEGGDGKKPFGIDVLRWWVACHANQDSLVHVNDNVLNSCSVEVQKIRSVMRFILGALKDYDIENDNNRKLLMVDKYMLHILYNYNFQVKQYLEDYSFNKIGKSVINLLSNEISALYYPAIKDRLYCENQNSSIRRSAQFTLLQIFEIITMSVGAITPHLVEELYMHLPFKKENSYFTTSHKGVDESWKNENINEVMELILDIRKNLNFQIGTGGSTTDVNIVLSEKMFHKLQSLTIQEDFEYEIANILQVAKVNINYDINQTNDYQLKIAKSKRYHCSRCRRTQSDKEDELCERCLNVLNTNIDNKESLKV